LVESVVNAPSARTEFEDTFVRALARRDVHAVASHTLLVTRYVGEKTDEVYHPGAVYYAVTSAYDPGYGSLDTIEASGRSQVLDDSIAALIGNLEDKGLLE
jgi:hypothetical protein